MSADTLFGFGPYLAAAVAVLGVVGRIVALRAHPAPDVARADRWALLGRGPIARWALLLLLFGHVLFLLAPSFVLRALSSRTVLYVVEAGSFLVGSLALVGVVGGLRWHLLVSRGSRRAELGDAAFLSALALTLACGLYTAARYRWASLWGIATVVPYVRSLTDQPATSLVAAIPAVAQLHIVAAFGAIAALPFSRLGGVLCRAGMRAFESIADAVEKVLRALVNRLRPRWLASLIWPEDEQWKAPTATTNRAERRAPDERPAGAGVVGREAPALRAEGDG